MIFRSLRRSGVVFFSIALICWFFPNLTFAASCTNGAEVAQPELCRFFYHYADTEQPLDPRIGERVGASSSDQTRSIALVIGISSYPNIPASIRAAKRDVDRLKSFLTDDQYFDEVIVLENSDATRENIDYFLNIYVPQRVILFGGRSRFLFAYTGHATPESGIIAPSLVLSQAISMSDTGNLYSLALLRTSLENLAKSNFHVLAMINACYGGNIFANAPAGGNPSVSNEPGSYALTAGSSDMLVATLGGPNDGSIFFDAVINGVKTGEADKGYPTAVDVNGDVIQEGGVVRLGALTNYLTTLMEKIPPLQLSGVHTPLKVKAPWIGPVEPASSVARGGFFFLSPVTTRNATRNAKVINIPPGPGSSIPGRPDIKIFGAPDEYPIRGITVSVLEGDIDWAAVKKTGITFAYIRAGSSHGKDPKFAHHWKETGKLGIDRGAYLVYGYCQPVATQLELMRSVLPDGSSSLPIALNVEASNSAENDDPAEMACAHSATEQETCDRVFNLAEKLRQFYGKTPVIYANRKMLATLTHDSRFEHYMIWLASDTTRGEPGSSSLGLSGGNPWTLWQYTTQRTLPGIGEQCDSDVFFGTPDQYEIFKAGIGNVALDSNRSPRI